MTYHLHRSFESFCLPCGNLLGNHKDNWAAKAVARPSNYRIGNADVPARDKLFIITYNLLQAAASACFSTPYLPPR